MYRAGLCFGRHYFLFRGWICVKRFGSSCFGAGSGFIVSDCISGIIVCCLGNGFVSCDWDFLVLELDLDA